MNENAKPTIFIVDDDDEFRNSLKVLIETRGFRVEQYASGEAFLSALRPVSKRCLLLDLHMPETSGIEVLQALKSRGITLPTIAITGASDTRLENGALLAGALAILDKPLQYGQLFKLISQALA